MKKLLAAGLMAMLLAGCSTSPYMIKKNGRKLVFYAKIPNAQQVYLVSSATNFSKVKAKKIGNNLWEAEIPYKQGLIKYFYLVNGHIFLPPCKTKVKDGFGGEDCVFIPSQM